MSENSEAFAFLGHREVLAREAGSDEEVRSRVVCECDVDDAQECLAVVSDEGVHCGNLLGVGEGEACSFP